MDYQLYVSIDPEIRFGRPCLTGTRISVADVLGWLGSGQTIPEMTIVGGKIVHDAKVLK